MRSRRAARQLQLDLGDDPEAEHDDAFPPGPNYLSRFRRAIGEEGIVDEADVRAFENAIKEWLRDIENEQRHGRE